MSQQDIVLRIRGNLESIGWAIEDLADYVSRDYPDSPAGTILDKRVQRLARRIGQTMVFLDDTLTDPVWEDSRDGELAARERLAEEIGLRGKASTDESSVHDQMQEMHEEIDSMKNDLAKFVTKSSIWARMIPLFLIIAAIIAYPFYGMLTHMAPGSLAQYMAPVSGLAGAIIGYWFGRSDPGDPAGR